MEDFDPSGFSLLQEAVEDHEPFDFSDFHTEGADVLASEDGSKHALRLTGAGSAAQGTQDEGLRNLRASLTGNSETVPLGATTAHGVAFLSHLDNSGHLEPSLVGPLSSLLPPHHITPINPAPHSPFCLLFHLLRLLYLRPPPSHASSRAARGLFQNG